MLGIIVFCIITYLCYWVAKNVSYMIFYESMVQDTIREMVKAGALIQ